MCGCKKSQPVDGEGPKGDPALVARAPCEPWGGQFPNPLVYTSPVCGPVYLSTARKFGQSCEAWEAAHDAACLELIEDCPM